jgi:hypothetical protein
VIEAVFSSQLFSPLLRLLLLLGTEVNVAVFSSQLFSPLLRLLFLLGTGVMVNPSLLQISQY